MPALVDEARAFLAGPQPGGAGSSSPATMQELSEALDFEGAALLRDRIRALTQVQGRQDINVAGPRRCRRDRRAPGRRPDLRPGVLLPRRPELGQPRLFPEPRPPARRSRTCSPPSSASSTTTSRRRRYPVSHVPAERDAVAEALSTRAGRAGRARRRRSAATSASWSSTRSTTRARRWRAGSPKARRSASC